MKRRHFIGAAAATGIAIHGRADAQSTTNLRIAHVLSPTEPAHEACVRFADRVNARSQGRVKMEVFPQGQLGGNKEMHELMKQGANVAILTSPSEFGDFVPDFGVLNGPYLLKEPGEFKKILASKWFSDLNEKGQREQQLRVLTFNGFFGARHALANKPLRSPDDFKGIAFRVPPTLIWLETFKSLGTRPVTIPWPEIYGAMQQGVADAVEAPLPSLWGMKLHETRKVISLTGHFLSWIGWCIHERVWQRIPADMRAIVQEEAIAAGDFMTERTMAAEADLLKRFREAGLQIVSDLDFPALQKATERVYSAVPNWSPGLHDTIKKILAS